jgi:hypothetical protein
VGMLFSSMPKILERTSQTVVLVYWYTRGYLMQPSVKNWNPLTLDNHNYKFIDLEPTQTAPKE